MKASGHVSNNINTSVWEPFALRYRRVNAPLMLRYLSMNGILAKRRGHC